MAIGLRGQAKREGWMSTKTVRLAALLGTLILMSVAVNAMVILAHGSNIRPRTSSAEKCWQIAQGAERLVCYDTIAHRTAPHPFKGATAPLLNWSF
jgi:hypothetical protein